MKKCLTVALVRLRSATTAWRVQPRPIQDGLEKCVAQKVEADTDS